MTDKSMAMELVQNLPETISFAEIRSFFGHLDDVQQGKFTPEEKASVTEEKSAAFKDDLLRQLKETPPLWLPPNPAN